MVNNAAGGAMAILVLRWRGIQNHDNIYGKDVTYIYHESNERNADYLFPVILAEDSVGDHANDS